MDQQTLSELVQLEKSLPEQLQCPKAFYAAYYNLPRALLYYYRSTIRDKTHGGLSLLSFAAQGNAPNTLRFLLLETNGGYNDPSLLPPMITAVLQKSVRAFNVFMMSSAYHHHMYNVEQKTGRNAFHYAVITGNEYMTRVMMMINPKIVFVKCDNGWTPLRYATYTKRPDFVQMLAPYYDMHEIRECLNVARESGFPYTADLLRMYLNTQQKCMPDVEYGALCLHALTLAV